MMGFVEKVAFLADNQAIMHIGNLFIYVVFGAFLVPLALAVYERLKPSSPAILQIATAFGLIWAGLIIASGMVFNIGMRTVVDHLCVQADAGFFAVHSFLTVILFWTLLTPLTPRAISTARVAAAWVGTNPLS